MPDAWHYHHMLDPTSMSPGSIMPRYPWLISDDLDTGLLEGKIEAMRTLGVPYPADLDARAALEHQAAQISGSLAEAGIACAPEKEIIALIAYLQRLGTDIHAESTAQHP